MFWNRCWGWWRKGDDDLKGSAGRDWLFGGRGNDVIDGKGGNDWLFGGRGDDTIYGGAGHDVVFAGRGHDSVEGGDGNDHVWGGGGDDDIKGGAGRDKLKGGWGDDTIDGGEGNDVVRGGAGNDIVKGGAGRDYVNGGSGDDTGMYNGADNQGFWDYYNGGRGNDKLYLQLTSAEAEAAAVEIAAYRALLDAGHYNRAFHFKSLDLKVKNWEDFEVVITDDAPGGGGGPVAVDDAIVEPTMVIQEVENNDPDMSDLSKFAQVIDRADFRIFPNQNVGDESLPSVSIEAEIEPDGDVDLFAFDLNVGEIITLDIDFTTFVNNNFSEPDTFIWIKTETGGATVAMNGDASPDLGGAGSLTPADAYLQYEATTSGTHYVGVQELFNMGTGPYTLNVSITPVDGNPTNLGGFIADDVDLLANDDPELVQIVSVDNALNGSAELTPGGDVFITPDNAFAAAFDYTAVDSLGNLSTATVAVNGNLVEGTSGEDVSDGTTGNDIFASSAGNDVFTGDDGKDVFVLSQGTGADRINDLMVGTDALLLTEGMTVSSIEWQNNDSLVNFDTGDSVLLVGVKQLGDIDDVSVG